MGVATTIQDWWVAIWPSSVSIGSPYLHQKAPFHGAKVWNLWCCLRCNMWQHAWSNLSWGESICRVYTVIIFNFIWWCATSHRCKMHRHMPNGVSTFWSRTIAPRMHLTRLSALVPCAMVSCIAGFTFYVGVFCICAILFGTCTTRVSSHSPTSITD